MAGLGRLRQVAVFVGAIMAGGMILGGWGVLQVADRLRGKE